MLHQGPHHVFDVGAVQRQGELLVLRVPPHQGINRIADQPLRQRAKLIRRQPLAHKQVLAHLDLVTGRLKGVEGMNGRGAVGVVQQREDGPARLPVAAIGLYVLDNAATTVTSFRPPGRRTPAQHCR